MQFIGDIVRETDERFGLGPKTHRLVISALRRIIELESGGLQGFCARLEREGFGEDLTNWRDPSQPLRLPQSRWIEVMLEPQGIADMGRELGLANARVRTALEFVIPALIRFFSRESRLPTLIPAAILESLETSASVRVHTAKSPSQRGARTQRTRKKSSTTRWLWALGSAILLASGFRLGRTILFEKSEPPVSNPEIARLAEPQAQPGSLTEPAPHTPPPVATGPQSRLVIRNVGQTVEYFGYLDSEETQRRIQEKLALFFGASRLSGDLIIDPERGSALWQTQLDRVLPQLNVPGLDIRLDGNTVRVGGFLSEEDRAGILNSLMSTLGADYRFGYLRDERMERALDSNQWLGFKLRSFDPDAKVQDLIQVLNRWVIDFEEGSALFPDHSAETARQVAASLKGLRQSALIEVVVHSAPGPSAVKLAAERAVAIREALVRGGYPATLLKTRGVVEGKPAAVEPGGAEWVPLNRLEFRVVQLCDPQFPCEISNAHAPRQDPVIPPDTLRREIVDGGDEVKPVVKERAPSPSSTEAQAVVGARPRQPEPTASNPREEVAPAAPVTPLKALEAKPEPVPRAKPKPKSTPAPRKDPAPSKETEWYDPFGLF